MTKGCGEQPVMWKMESEIKNVPSPKCQLLRRNRKLMLSTKMCVFHTNITFGLEYFIG